MIEFHILSISSYARTTALKFCFQQKLPSLPHRQNNAGGKASIRARNPARMRLFKTGRHVFRLSLLLRQPFILNFIMFSGFQGLRHSIAREEERIRNVAQSSTLAVKIQQSLFFIKFRLFIADRAE
jgi:hypothetical protein